MYSFKDDYSEGAHPKILEALVQTNLEQEDGYSMDTHCQAAIMLIKKIVEDESVDVHFISGGTQANLLAISCCLRPHEACISAHTGHIATHESGAIEATGHKIITVENPHGKLSPENIAPVLSHYSVEYEVKPRIVYISNPTELGTVYTKAELEALYAYCQSNQLLLYMDGARLASALVVPEAELSLKVINNCTDAFFLGGTKNGALLGEALVLSNEAFKSDFRYILKQKGAMMAKGRVMGIQFEKLLEDDLYLKLADHARSLAQKVQGALRARGIRMLVESPTNQIFPILPNEMIKKLEKDYAFHIWEKIDESSSCIRLVFSWATPEQEAESFMSAIEQIKEAL